MIAIANETKTVAVKNKGGRPLKNIDAKLVLELAKIHCTQREIAAICDCSVDTLQGRFSAVIEKGMEEGRRSLRRLQWEQAEKGNTQMLIWLGKQMLGQKDKQPDEVTQINYNVMVNEVPK